MSEVDLSHLAQSATNFGYGFFWRYRAMLRSDLRQARIAAMTLGRRACPIWRWTAPVQQTGLIRGFFQLSITFH
jgi:hypothetical protein